MLLAGLLAGCAVAPPQLAPPAAVTLAQTIAGLPNGRLYRVDTARSAVRIHAFRAGRAAQLGHNHVLSVPQLAGFAWLPTEGLLDARLELEFRLDELVLDRPEQRAALGPGWASAVSPEAIAATRANMLGEGNLQAERFPWVRLHLRQVSGELPKLAAQVEVELHGEKRALWLPLQAEIDGPQLKVSGALVLRQSDFGIAPFSVLGGLLAVRDELVIEFELSARRDGVVADQPIRPSNGITSTHSPAATSP